MNSFIPINKRYKKHDLDIFNKNYSFKDLLTKQEHINNVCNA